MENTDLYMSNITLATVSKGIEDSFSWTTKLDKELYDPTFIGHILELVELSGVPESDFNFQVESTYVADGLRAQNIYLQLGDKHVVFHSIKADVDSKERIDEFVQVISKSIEYAKKEQAHEVTLAVISHLSLPSLLQARESEIIQKERASVVSTRMGIILESSVLTEVAKVLIESITIQGDPHHKYELCDSVQDTLDWAFQELAGELQLQKAGT